MTLEQYWAIALKRWKFILGCFLVVGLGAYIASKFVITPIYQSSVLVQVLIHQGNSTVDYNGLQASSNFVQTEAQLATSDAVLQEVASHFPGTSAAGISKEVTSTFKLNTQLFEIDVQDPNPKRAAALANDVAVTLIKQQLQEIKQNYDQSVQELEYDLDNTASQMDLITSQIDTLQSQRGHQAQITLLQEHLSGLQGHYNSVQETLGQLRLSEAQSDNFLLIAQVAQPNPNPVLPNKILNTAEGLLAGLLLGMLLAILFELLDVRVHTPEAVTKLLGVPTLATVWQALPNESVVNPAGRNAYAESYRILRTNIGFAHIDNPLRSLIVISAMPSDGKSVIAANLAIFMAKAGKPALLIDANLRHPTLHEMFHLPPDKQGLTNALLSFSVPKAVSPLEISTDDSRPLNGLAHFTPQIGPFIHSVEIPNLWVMPSGPLPTNPSEILDSKAMQHLLTMIKDCSIEIVIFDTCPLLGFSDASILASKVDEMLVVVDIKRAYKKHLEQMKALLAQAGIKVIGCVLNKQDRVRRDTTYSSFYYQNEEAQSEEDHGSKDEEDPTLPTLSAIHQPNFNGREADHIQKN